MLGIDHGPFVSMVQSGNNDPFRIQAEGVQIREDVMAKNYLLRMIHVVALTFFSYW